MVESHRFAIERGVCGHLTTLPALDLLLLYKIRSDTMMLSLFYDVSCSCLA